MAYYLKAEITKRGTLHAHGQVAQPWLRPAAFRKLMESEGAHGLFPMHTTPAGAAVVTRNDKTGG